MPLPLSDSQRPLTHQRAIQAHARRDGPWRLNAWMRGRTHLTELGDLLPTAVAPAFAGEVTQALPDSDTQPFQIDRCHALASDGDAVRLHCPRWFRQPGANKLSENPAPATPSAPPGD